MSVAITDLIKELRKANEDREIRSIKIGSISYTNRPTEDKTYDTRLEAKDVSIVFEDYA